MDDATDDALISFASGQLRRHIYPKCEQSACVRLCPGVSAAFQMMPRTPPEFRLLRHQPNVTWSRMYIANAF